MLWIKKYGVWLALLFTLAATIRISQQEKADELVVSRGENSLALNDDKKVKPTKLKLDKAGAEVIKQDDQAVTPIADRSIIRSPDYDAPKNIFTPFIDAQNNPDVNAESVVTMPDNPFIYAGKIIEDGSLVVFLIEGEKSHAVKSGDLIEDTWKVKSITPTTMTLKNIPLKIEIQMEIGAKS
jgi:hypothetical protein